MPAGACAPAAASAASPARILAADISVPSGAPACIGAAVRSVNTSAGGAPGSDRISGTSMLAGTSGRASRSIFENVGNSSLSSYGRYSLRARSAALISGSTPRSARNRLSEM